MFYDSKILFNKKCYYKECNGIPDNSLHAISFDHPEIANFLISIGAKIDC